MDVSIKPRTPYHGIVPSAIAITHWTSRKEVVTGSKTRALELHSVEVFGTGCQIRMTNLEAGRENTVLVIA
jgi:hypothetical protein